MANLKHLQVSFAPGERIGISYDYNTGFVHGVARKKEVKVVVETKRNDIFCFYENSSSPTMRRNENFSKAEMMLPIVNYPNLQNMHGKTATIAIGFKNNICGIEIGILRWQDCYYLVQEERWRVGMRDGKIDGVNFRTLTDFLSKNVEEFSRKSKINLHPAEYQKQVLTHNPEMGGLVRIDWWSPVKTIGSGREMEGKKVLLRLDSVSSEFKSPMNLKPGMIVRCHKILPLPRKGAYDFHAIGIAPHSVETKREKREEKHITLGDNNPALKDLNRSLRAKETIN